MIYFITQKWLKDNTPITANVDAGEVMVWTKVNAENWVRKIIGTHFFNILLTKYNNKTLTPDEATLVELMKPAIAWRAASDAALSLSYQLKREGVQTQRGDYSDSAALNEIQFMMQHFADKAGIYEAAIYDYFKVSGVKDLYSEFMSKLNVDSSAKRLCNGGGGYNKSIMII